MQPNTSTKESWHAPLNRVTSVSKVLAAILFIMLPVFGFFLGVQYAVEAPDEATSVLGALGM